MTPLKKMASPQQPLTAKASQESMGAFLMSPSATHAEMLVSLISSRSCPACDYSFCEFECNSHALPRRRHFPALLPCPGSYSLSPHLCCSLSCLCVHAHAVNISFRAYRSMGISVRTTTYYKKDSPAKVESNTTHGCERQYRGHLTLDDLIF